ncbi:hypothetical protein, partial [Lacticaseibacillus manihotivorans]|uniref:hypothetical protein n=1 Tax=Lacticaseibacillus manihotivorans TaxID=88233 RepID=UPI001FB21E96
MLKSIEMTAFLMSHFVRNNLASANDCPTRQQFLTSMARYIPRHNKSTKQLPISWTCGFNANSITFMQFNQ